MYALLSVIADRFHADRVETEATEYRRVAAARFLEVIEERDDRLGPGAPGSGGPGDDASASPTVPGVGA